MPEARGSDPEGHPEPEARGCSWEEPPTPEARAGSEEEQHRIGGTGGPRGAIPH